MKSLLCIFVFMTSLALAHNHGVEATVISLLAKHTPTQASMISRETKFGDDLNFDSLNVLEVTMAIEEEFDTSLEGTCFNLCDDGEIVLRTVGDLIDYLESLLQ